MLPALAAAGTEVSGVGDLELAADRSQLGLARRFTASVATAYGLDSARGNELVYAVNEAVTNAITHGRPDPSGRIRISVVAERDLLTLEVSDSGKFMIPDGAAQPADEHGRGFTLMRHFADRLSLRIGGGGTTVRLSKVRT